MTGLFIVFEGGEGSGKSTQAAALAQRIGALLTRQPGGTALGGALRELLLDPANHHMAPKTEALLMAADRAQHEAELIGPTLEAGTHVVCDRYIGSSIAYQGVGRNLGVDEIERISMWAVHERVPDVVVLLDVSEATAMSRLDRPLDRVELAGPEFHEAIRAAYRRLAANDDRWVSVDGNSDIATVQERVWNEVVARCGECL